jgi:type II secretory pathway component GspD/PulD (secretin)
MKRLGILVFLFVLTVPVSGGDDVANLVDDLFHDDAAVREKARVTLLQMGPEVLPVILGRIEERQAPEQPADVTEIYDVRDLLEKKGIAALVSQVRASVGDGIHEIEGRDDGVLVVVAEPAVQRAVRRILAELRSGGQAFIMIEAKIFRGEKALAAPSVICEDRNTATVQVGRQRSYVQGFSVRRTEKGEVVADPSVAQVWDGLNFELVPTLSEDGERITLDIDLKLANVPDPIPVREVQIEGFPAKLQVPEIREVRRKTALVLPDGGSGEVDLGMLPGSGETTPLRVEISVHLLK